MMKRSYLYIISLFVILNISSQNTINHTVSISADRNYIMTVSPLDEVKAIVYNNGTLTVNSPVAGARSQISIAYFDGLGRPVQTVQRSVTPTKKDLVALQEYDLFGREAESWLPVSFTANGSYILPETVKNATKSLYNDQHPYNKPVYENSPSNSIIEQYGPGQQWHINGKSVKTNYLTNDFNHSCTRFEVGVNTLISRGNYASGELYVTEVKDENGNLSYQFKDKRGRVVLTRQMNGSIRHDTYYVYDDQGNLCYVLPPQAVDNLIGGMNDNSVVMQQYAYLYQYDKRNRCIKKRLPGCDWISYIYDKSDNLILSQDGEQRAKGEWLFTIPDAFGRPALTGVCKNLVFQVETYLSNSLVKATWTNANTAYKGYTISGITLTTPSLLTVNYYDQYDFVGKNGFPVYSYLSAKEAEGYGKRYTGTKGYEYKGLLTGTITATMGNEYQELYSVMYYDAKKRLIQVRSNNHTGGTDLDCIAYDFAGSPTKKYTEQVANGITTKELYTYTYDHAGRLTETKHKLNNLSEVSLAKNTYDELGRLGGVMQNNNATLNTTYTYNTRSWINTIQNPQFQEYLDYEYNGNIRMMRWTQMGATRTYNYTYDGLSRLTYANYTGVGSEQYMTNYTYDKMGNMTSLLRYGKVMGSSYSPVDVLAMTYKGNQLFNTHDTGANSLLIDSHDFKDYSKDASKTKTEYTYNQNGAMVTDLNKGISNIQYNSLNLPVQIDIKSPVAEARNEYLYSATGQKLKVTQRWNPHYSTYPVIGSAVNTSQLTQTKTTDYVGNKTYENRSLKRILINGGYIENNQYNYYITDHLGNNRLVANPSGGVTQGNHYYPFGMNIVDDRIYFNSQPYKYSGKEFDTSHGLNLYDSSARLYDGTVPRFTTVDPKAENFYSESPYIYVSNNPLKYIDPDGREKLNGLGPERVPYRDEGRGVRARSHIDNNMIHIYSHGTQKGFTFVDASGNSTRVRTARNFADFLEANSRIYKNAGFDKSGVQIVLHSCNTGEDYAFAEIMSTEMPEVTIIAPQGSAILDENTGEENVAVLDIDDTTIIRESVWVIYKNGEIIGRIDGNKQLDEVEVAEKEVPGYKDESLFK